MIPKKPALGLDPRVDTGFRKRSCSTKRLERDDGSKRSHHALEILRAATSSLEKTLTMQACVHAHQMAAFDRDGTIGRFICGRHVAGQPKIAFRPWVHHEPRRG